MADKKTSTTIVKKFRDLTWEELKLLPTAKAVLRKNEFKKSGQVQFLLTIALAKDFNQEIRLTEEQYALIKLVREIANDLQSINVIYRISKGKMKTDENFYLLEVYAAKDIYFHMLLSNVRSRQLEILQSRGLLPEKTSIDDYPETNDLTQELTLTIDDK